MNERAANEAAARKFFGRKRGRLQILQLREEGGAVRAVRALSPGAFWGEYLEARIRADTAKPGRIRAAVNELLTTQQGQLVREEVRMDAIARGLRGAPPYPDAEAEARRRAFEILAARHAALIRRTADARTPPSIDGPDDRPAIAL